MLPVQEINTDAAEFAQRNNLLLDQKTKWSGKGKKEMDKHSSILLD